MANAWIVETKVVASTLASAGVGTAIAVLNDVQAHSELLGSIPAPIQVVVLVLIPTATAFLAGWRAKHTPRPDLGK